MPPELGFILVEQILAALYNAGVFWCFYAVGRRGKLSAEKWR